MGNEIIASYHLVVTNVYTYKSEEKRTDDYNCSCSEQKDKEIKTKHVSSRINFAALTGKLETQRQGQGTGTGCLPRFVAFYLKLIINNTLF